MLSKLALGQKYKSSKARNRFTDISGAVYLTWRVFIWQILCTVTYCSVLLITLKIAVSG